MIFDINIFHGARASPKSPFLGPAAGVVGSSGQQLHSSLGDCPPLSLRCLGSHTSSPWRLCSFLVRGSPLWVADGYLASRGAILRCCSHSRVLHGLRLGLDFSCSHTLLSSPLASSSPPPPSRFLSKAFSQQATWASSPILRNF